ncbi:MAG: hypothetical protein VB140_02435, partial [Burkholderia sp.]
IPTRGRPCLYRDTLIQALLGVKTALLHKSIQAIRTDCGRASSAIRSITSSRSIYATTPCQGES